MRLKVEEIEQEKPVLFVFKKPSSIIEKLKKRLRRYQYQISSSSFLPKEVSRFESIFIFREGDKLKEIEKKKIDKKKAIFFILINQKKQLPRIQKIVEEKKLKNVKVVNLDEDSFSEDSLEKLIWFLFSDSKEQVFNLERPFKKKQKKVGQINQPFFSLFDILKRRFSLFVFLAFFLGEFFFVLPLVGSGILLYQGTRAFERENFSQLKNSLGYLPFFLNLTEKSYRLSRPILSVFYLAPLFDKPVSLEKDSYLVLDSFWRITENSKRLFPLILKQNKESQEKKELILRLTRLRQQVEELSERIKPLYQKMDYKIGKVQRLKKKLVSLEDTVNQFKKILLFADEILGKKSEKKYLILFENNMELRPGGGFIGSFGVVTVSDYTLKKLEIEDVYQADGQLKAHVEPPLAIKKYLNQPHWFLRDSGFSPDFKENFNQAESFLSKELNLADFDGGMAITTTAINYILDAFGDIYLPDYKETINKDNFYIKTQLYVEKNFFPGSIQKKSFLSSLVRILLLKTEEVSYKRLAIALKKSLAEKQIVLYFKNKDLDKLVNLFGWGGRVIIPKCINKKERCLVDGFYPIDANLGVNKANFFISRLINFKVRIKEDGQIENLFSLVFKNNSPKTVFPGGPYRNYFQIYLPKNCQIVQITKNGILLNTDEYEEKNEAQFKIVAVFFTVPPGGSTEVKINYSLEDKIVKGRNIYQLITQKQIGSSNNDLVLEFYFPKNVFIASHNFPTLAKDNHLIYNTNLSTDKIFFIELVKE